jgi:hypothetical protein
LNVLLLFAQCKMHYWWLVTWLDLTLLFFILINTACSFWKPQTQFCSFICVVASKIWRLKSRWHFSWTPHPPFFPRLLSY